MSAAATSAARTARISSQPDAGPLEPTAGGVSVAGGVITGVGVGERRARTVALAWFEVVSLADDAVATFVTLPAVTSARVIV